MGTQKPDIIGIGFSFTDISVIQLPANLLVNFGNSSFKPLHTFTEIEQNEILSLKGTLRAGGAISNSLAIMSHLGLSTKFITKLANDRYGIFYKNRGGIGLLDRKVAKLSYYLFNYRTTFFSCY
ncbi:MAG: hypothetical protein JXR30_00875, partial [Alphaproteobacteria bacterium]|nr:hypothetical protein [Alphaproteobacteria bacterium]